MREHLKETEARERFEKRHYRAFSKQSRNLFKTFSPDQNGQLFQISAG